MACWVKASPRDGDDRRGYSVDMRFRVVIEQDEDGVYVARCPALPGCVSQGRTRQEAHAAIRDAAAGHVASLEKHGDPIPPPIDEDVVEIAVST